MWNESDWWLVIGDRVQWHHQNCDQSQKMAASGDDSADSALSSWLTKPNQNSKEKRRSYHGGLQLIKKRIYKVLLWTYIVVKPSNEIQNKIQKKYPIDLNSDCRRFERFDWNYFLIPNIHTSVMHDLILKGEKYLQF